MVKICDLRVMTSIVNERVSSLVNDGYILMFKTHSDVRAFYKLRHRYNGTFITIYAYYSLNLLQQFTNGVCVHNAPIWNHPNLDA